ncbi:MAG: hypothetical protein KIS76_10950 [Pyrinomonadaceae bacterium]|nr:hypothetical protein [Pyrinomonadaceae bacterium]
MNDNEKESSDDLRMRHEQIELKDGRHMIFYEFDELNSGDQRKRWEPENDSLEDEDV